MKKGAASPKFKLARQGLPPPPKKKKFEENLKKPIFPKENEGFLNKSDTF